ncbi:maleate isomerase [Arthrobacter crystallopoietes]|uniref:Maleate isomerase n=1 Tax=Crystallibacter crystallopoietes TaxID=37928 RepID=A0A1H1HY80_9MICC|nr:maleate isomerase [Arthrobacter crystallopoietes]
MMGCDPAKWVFESPSTVEKFVSTPDITCETVPAPKQAGLSRIGLIVPSSNTTMETELPELFRRQSEATGQKYTFHSARAGMKNVNKEELLAMVGKAAGCAAAVSDADVDAIAYACLVAVMAQGPNAHVGSEETIAKAAEDNGHPAAVTSSAGALVRTLQEMGARKVAMVTPYMKPLTQMVREYIEGAGIEVLDAVSLEVADNLAVGCLDPQNLPEIARNLKREGADAIVLSACVQMPSLPAVQAVEDELGLPVITAATATAYEILKALGHEPSISGAGSLLSGVPLKLPARV